MSGVACAGMGRTGSTVARRQCHSSAAMELATVGESGGVNPSAAEPEALARAPGEPGGGEGSSEDICVWCHGAGDGLRSRRDEFACACVECQFHDDCWNVYNTRATVQRPTKCPICSNVSLTPPLDLENATWVKAILWTIRGGGILLTATSLGLLIAAVPKLNLESWRILAFIAVSAAIVLYEYACQFAYGLRDRLATEKMSRTEQLEREFHISWHAKCALLVRVVWVVASIAMLESGELVERTALLWCMSASMAARMVLMLGAMFVFLFKARTHLRQAQRVNA